jgi:hypothetical protein
VISGNSVEIRVPAGSWSPRSAGWSLGTASTIFTGLLVAFEYSSSQMLTTSAPVSVIQSRPVMPRSKSPCSTYCGISCGRSRLTRPMRGSSIEAW